MCFGQVKYSFNIADATRDDGKLYLWIYFKDKDRSLKKVQISKKTLARRNKVHPNKNFEWYDLRPSEAYIDQIKSTGATLRGESRWFNAVSIECDEEQLDAISSFSFVDKIEPIRQYRKPVEVESQDKRSLNKILDFDNEFYGNSYSQVNQINVPAAHKEGYHGQGVSVLVLDTGFNLEHPVFDELNVIAEWDVIYDDSTTRNETGQDASGNQHNHGTSVLSILAGYAPDTLIGPAFQSDFILAKTEILDKEIVAEEDNYVRALEWGETLGADIMTASLGYTDWYIQDDMDGNTAITTKAVDIAVAHGIVCVVSAGNENNNNWGTIVAPADADSVISVGALGVDPDNNVYIASFSSRGPTADGRTKPEVCAMGVNTFRALGNGSSYYTGNGTSFAAPLVAGAAALILNANPDWTPMMVREALMMTASHSDRPDNTYGWGIVDTWAAINYTGGNNFLKPELKQNYRNPFKTSTTIKYKLLQSAKVKLKIYNIIGQEIVTLVDKFEPSGTKTVVWNGRDANDQKVSSGVYIYTLTVGETQISNKMVLIN